MSFLHVIIILLALLPVHAGAKPKPISIETGKQTLSGTIFPNSVNTEGHPTSFFLSVVSEANPDSTIEYEIVESGSSNENLIRLLYQTIEAECIISVGKNGKLSASILSAKVLENKPEDIEEEF